MSTLAKRTFTGKKIGSGARNILTVLLALVYLIPLYIAVVNSVKPYQDVIKAPLSPTLQPTMENFTEAFHSSKILSLYGTSILITGSSLLLLIFISSTAAYIIIRRKNRILPLTARLIMPGDGYPERITKKQCNTTKRWTSALSENPTLCFPGANPTRPDCFSC